MAKSIHKLPDSQVDGVVLAAIIDEHRQTRRPVATSMVFIAVNAGSDVDRSAVILSLGRLKRAGKAKRESPSSAWLPTAGAEAVVTHADQEVDAEQDKSHSPDYFGMGEPFDDPELSKGSNGETAPEIHGPIPGEAAEFLDSMPWESNEVHGPMPPPLIDVSGAQRAFAGAKRAMASFSKGAQQIPCTQEQIDPGFSAALLDRCAAMHMTLLEQSREAYRQGDPAAGRELLWLIETGRQLRDAGGVHD